MKKKITYIVLFSFILIVLSSCQSTLTPKIGMDRNAWLQRTLVADQVYLNDVWEVWRSGNRFYYFKNGKLDHIDQGSLMEKRFRIEIINK
jgi:hypothetical protein